MSTNRQNVWEWTKDWTDTDIYKLCWTVQIPSTTKWISSVNRYVRHILTQNNWQAQSFWKICFCSIPTFRYWNITSHVSDHLVDISGQVWELQFFKQARKKCHTKSSKPSVRRALIDEGVQWIGLCTDITKVCTMNIFVTKEKTSEEAVISARCTTWLITAVW